MSAVDNERTFLYKWASKKHVPASLVVISKSQISDNTEDRFRDYTYRYAIDILSSMDKRSGSISLDDFVITIQDLSIVPLDTTDITFAWYDFYKDSRPIEGLFDEINKWYTDNYKKYNEDNPKYSDTDDLDTYYSAWKRNLADLISNTRREATKIISQERALLEYKPVKYSDISYTSYTYRYRPKFVGGKSVTVDNAIDIFNNVTLSTGVPFIAYTFAENFECENTRTYSKLFMDWPNKLLDYNIFIPDQREVSMINMIYIILYLKEITPQTELNRKDFIMAKYDIESNSLTVDFQVEYEDIVDDLLSECFKSILDLGESSIVESKGSLQMTLDSDFITEAFLDMCLREPLFNTYLYVDEKRMTPIFKDFFVIHSRSFDFADESGESNIGLRVTLRSPTTLGVEVSSTTDINLFKNFVDILTYILGAYQQIVNGNSYAPYRSFLRASTLSTGSKRKAKEKVKLGGHTESKLDTLSRQAPEIFVTGYGGICQNKNQPILIPGDEVEEYLEGTFRHNNKEYRNQVIPFPLTKENIDHNITITETGKYKVTIPQDPEKRAKYYFAGDPESGFPFIGVKKNSKLDNRDDFPYIPCGYELNHLDRNNRSSEFNNYYDEVESGIETIEIPLEGYKMPDRLSISSNIKILNPYQGGELPTVIKNILGNNYIRLGTVRSESSLLHAVCEAIDDQEYLETDIMERENYIINLRHKIATESNFACAAQELYDHTDKESYDAFYDELVYLDPSYFYRIVEEYFNINIFVFDIEENKLEIPRNRICHIRTVRDRATVIVCKYTRGEHKTRLSYPQCEPIIRLMDKADRNIRAVKVFGKKVRNMMFDLLNTTNQIYMASFDPSLTIRSNYYQNSIVSVVGIKKCRSMIVDPYGKMRGIIVKGKNGPITLLCPPSQPEDLPITKDEVKCNIGDVLSIMPNPYSAAIDDKGNAIGLWYSYIDIQEAIFVPINDAKAPNEIPTSSKLNPLFSSNMTGLNKIDDVKRQAMIIQRIIEYLFDIYRMELSGDLRSPSKATLDDSLPDKFIRKYLIVDSTGPRDSLIYYDFSKSKKEFPTTNNLKDALRALSKQIPTLVSEKGIIMYNEALRDKMEYFIKMYFKTTKGQTPKPHTQLFVYVNENDFKQQKGVGVFLHYKDMFHRVGSIKRASKAMTMETTVDDARLSLEPYIYQNEDQIYMIQNIFDGSLKTALYVCSIWNEKKINIGGMPSRPENFNGNNIRYIILGIDDKGQLVTYDDQSSGNDKYMEILFYGSLSDYKDNRGKFASMLPMIPYI
jgi:hypothetical protein